jgi:uncharacterized protein (TIGR00251 family)
MSLTIRESERGATFAVRVLPRGRRNEIVGVLDDALKVRVSAPPVEGAANAAVVKLVAKTLSVPNGNVEIVSGQSARLKVLLISGLSAQDVRALLRI